MSTAPLLATRDLTMRFGGVTALDRVTFSLDENELRCLIGPNGAGKSTFFKCLTGQHKPAGGSIRFLGQTVIGRDSAQIARMGIGMKTQVPSLFEGLSVRENIWLSANRAVGGEAADDACAQIIEQMRIAEIATRTVGRLAHGERQFVELGMVIATKPALILLDEPAAGLSVREAVRIADLIHEINRKHALIVVEHDMQFIRLIATKVTVFYRGRILMEDTLDMVMDSPEVRAVYLGTRAA